jgi:hypothetical protein
MSQIILSIAADNDKIVRSDDIACYIVADNLAATTINQVVATGKMVLVQGTQALEICNKYNLDGVVKEIDATKPLKPQVKPLREKLKKKTLGIIVPARRHEAMLAGEVEPEFIAFKSENLVGSKEVIDWYNEFFLIPLAVVVQDELGPAAELKADFIITKALKTK